jgi:hypothetical protein
MKKKNTTKLSARGAVASTALFGIVVFTIWKVRRFLANRRNDGFRRYLADHPEVLLRTMPRDTASRGAALPTPATHQESAGASCQSASSFAQADTCKSVQHPHEGQSDATTSLSRILLGLGSPCDGGAMPNEKGQARLP